MASFSCVNIWKEIRQNKTKKKKGKNLTHLPKEEERKDSGFWLAIQLYIRFYRRHRHLLPYTSNK
jgi:hypothetical protein